MNRSFNDRAAGFCGGAGVAGLIMLAARSNEYADAVVTALFAIGGLAGVVLWVTDWILDRGMRG